MDNLLPPPAELEALLGDAAPPSGRGLLGSVTALAHGLRAKGVRIGQKSVLDGLRAAALVGPRNPWDLRQALAANLTASQEEEEIFNQLFAVLFLGRGRLSPEEEPDRQVTSLTPEPAALRLISPGKDDKTAVSPYSPTEVLTGKSLKDLSQGDFRQTEEFLSRRLEKILRKKSRRRRPGKGSRVDFRRTWRRSVPLGGEIMDLARTRRRIKERELILLLDVSGSMDSHTRFMLYLARIWLKHRPGKVQVFAFSTRLCRLTPVLADRPWETALEVVGRLMPEWSGGTRIGAALAGLMSGHGRVHVGPLSLVVLISDGWDRGDINLLENQMQRLRRKAWQVIWLNPLLGSPGYEPICAGMSTALKSLDLFLPVRTTDDLAAAGQTIATELNS
jgi:uncharacterized protein